MWTITATMTILLRLKNTGIFLGYSWQAMGLPASQVAPRRQRLVGSMSLDKVNAMRACLLVALGCIGLFPDAVAALIWGWPPGR